MEQIKTKILEATEQLISTSLEKNYKPVYPKQEKIPDWLPAEIKSKYDQTDLEYSFCLKLFADLQAAKRDKIPSETMRIWFIEFIKRGWTKKMLQERYNALMGKEMNWSVKIDDWINAKTVYAQDEIEIIIYKRINSLIQRGNFLKGKDYELNENDKIAIDLAAAKEVELGYKAGFYEARETYAEQRKRVYLEKFRVKK